MKKLFIIGIVLLIISGIIYYLRESKYNKIINNSLSMHELIKKEDNNNQRAYINTTMVPYYLAEYQKDDNAFYVVLDGKYLYLVYMNKEEAESITVDMVENGYRLNGITRAMPDNISSFGVSFLDNLFNSDDGHDHEIEHHEYDNNDYLDYFGDIYLDMTISKYADLTVYSVLFYTTLVLGLMLIITQGLSLIEKRN